jgi:hypothetical protein
VATPDLRPTIWLNDAMSQQQIAPVHHDDHGSTPAAWTAVIIIMLAFVVGTLAIVLGNWPMFWVGVGLVVVGAIAGKVLAMMGFGKKAS